MEVKDFVRNELRADDVLILCKNFSLFTMRSLKISNFFFLISFDNHDIRSNYFSGRNVLLDLLFDLIAPFSRHNNANTRKTILDYSCRFSLHQFLFDSKYSCNMIILRMSAKSSLISLIINIVTSVVYGTSTPRVIRLRQVREIECSITRRSVGIK